MDAVNIMRRTRDHRSEKGAELIEFALVFPLLLLLVMGIIDWGLVFTRYQVLFNAAREGARVSVLPGYTDADVRTRVNQYVQGIGLDAGNVTTTVGAPRTLSIGSGCISVRPVTTSYVHSFLFLGGPNGGIGSLFGGSFGTRTLSATASMRQETAAVACP
jgi:Flp pilus assembly protein TadG